MGTSLPQEISDIIIDEVAEEPEPVPRITTLRVCSLVSPAWAHRSQGHLFSKIEFNCEGDLRKWRAKIGADGPSYHVTHLHLTKISIDQILSDIAPAGWHMSSFTNLRILHLVRVPLQHEKVRFTYGAVGSTVSHLLLERCMTDIHHLTSFLRPFTNLENLSLLDPRMPSGPNPGYPPEPLSARGKINLELRINMVHCGQSFVDGLLLLPVAIRTITFSGHKPRIAPWENAPVPCMTEINKLLAASRETLTHLRVPSYLPWGIDLANVDALEELGFNVNHVHHIMHALQTITSSRLAVIAIDPNDSHHNYLDTWNRLDAALYALVDRVEPVRGPQDGSSRIRVKLFLRSETADCDFLESASQLLPKCIGRGCVMVFGAILEKPYANPEYSMY